MKAFYKTYFTGVRLRKSTHVHIDCVTVTDRLSQTFGAMAMQTYRITPCRWFEFSVVNKFVFPSYKYSYRHTNICFKCR